MNEPQRQALVELSVGPVAQGGSCVARHEGRVVFVRHALPGERVLARVTATGSRYWRADAIEILEAAPDRVTPPCPYAGPGRCGGCDWQHAALPLQRALKAQVLGEQLRRIGGVDLALAGIDVSVAGLPGSADGLGWRTRMQFAVDAGGAPGLHRHRGRDLEPVARCVIAHPGVERAGVEGLRWPGAGVVEVAASASTGERVLVVTPAGPGRFDPPAGLDSPLVVAGTPAAAAPAVHHVAAGRSFRVTAGGFWQVHPAAAEALSTAVLDLLDPRAGERVLDLYAGAGLFAASLAGGVGTGGRVVAVEADALAADDARANLADLPQVRVLRARVTPRVLSGPGLARALGGRPDVVVADPPRAGLGVAAMDALLSLRPRAVAYVACDGAALARDVGAARRSGYGLVALRAFDLFPMTAHVECVAVLSGSRGSPGPVT